MTTTTTAANSVYSVAMRGNGELIAAIAKYLDATVTGSTSADAALQALKQGDTMGVLRSLGTLRKYATTIKRASSLALASAHDYALVFSAMVKVDNPKIKGDWAATVAPLADMTLDEKRTALAAIAKGDNIVSREAAKPKNSNAKNSASADSDLPAVDSDSAAADALAHIRKAAKVINSATLSRAESEAIMIELTKIAAKLRK